MMREGRVDRIEASLTAGLSYIVRVRALAEIGTEASGRILESQLNRVITTDPLEQSWYWIDVAHCLRMMSHEDSLPTLLEKLYQADDFPLVHFYASEVAVFPHFTQFLKEFPDRHGIAAVRALHRTLEGLRCGISAQIVAEARLGEMVETVWDEHRLDVHPLLVKLFCEVLRHQRRSSQYSQDLSEEHFEQEAYELQVSRIAAIEEQMEDYLDDARSMIPRRMERMSVQDAQEWLDAVHELRADAGDAILRILRDNPYLAQSEHAILALGWSRSSQAADYLREQASRHLAAVPQNSKWPALGRSSHSQHSDMVAASLLALRHHPSLETEKLLLIGARSADSHIKASAVSSLGWWEPLQRKLALMYLQDARYDSNGEVRHAARAALARLGEWQALQWFKQGLSSENRHIVLESIQAIADEGITLLWPELDRLVDEEEPELASCAREALEQMQEALERDQRASS